jgi:hypothetical protein
MTIRGHSQAPGPLGLSRGGDGARIPGPTGTFWDGGRVPEPAGTWWDDGGWAPQPIGSLWDKQSNPPASGPATKAVKTTVMPAPTKDNDSRDVHVVLLPLFNPKTNVPSFTEVKQAPGIANCPVASMLAALAFTPDGQKIIESIVPPEISGDVVTDLSAAGTLSNPSGPTLSSKRYFTVKLGEGPVDVSDVLYTDDHDRGWSPFYMRDPGDQTIWAAVIEKALAAKLGSYENFDALNISANDFWKKITGVEPGQIEIKPDTPLAAITNAVKASVRVPSIAASKGDPGSDMTLKSGKSLAANHGFALMGFQGDNIRLYDPAKAETLLVTAAEFRQDFFAILFRK